MVCTYRNQKHVNLLPQEINPSPSLSDLRNLNMFSVSLYLQPDFDRLYSSVNGQGMINAEARTERNVCIWEATFNGA